MSHRVDEPTAAKEPKRSNNWRGAVIRRAAINAGRPPLPAGVGERAAIKRTVARENARDIYLRTNGEVIDTRPSQRGTTCGEYNCRASPVRNRKSHVRTESLPKVYAP